MQRPATLAFTKENELLIGSASSSDCDDYIQLPDEPLLLRGQLETFRQGSGTWAASTPSTNGWGALVCQAGCSHCIIRKCSEDRFS